MIKPQEQNNTPQGQGGNNMKVYDVYAKLSDSYTKLICTFYDRQDAENMIWIYSLNDSRINWIVEREQ